MRDGAGSRDNDKAAAMRRRPVLLRRDGLVTAEPDTHGDRDVLQVRPIGEHIVEAAFGEEAHTAGLDIETCPGVEAEFGLGRAGGILGLCVVHTTATDEVRAEPAALGRLELVDRIGGARDELQLGVAPGDLGLELVVGTVDLNADRRAGRYKHTAAKPCEPVLESRGEKVPEGMESPPPSENSAPCARAVLAVASMPTRITATPVATLRIASPWFRFTMQREMPDKLARIAPVRCEPDHKLHSRLRLVSTIRGARLSLHQPDYQIDEEYRDGGPPDPAVTGGDGKEGGREADDGSR